MKTIIRDSVGISTMCLVSGVIALGCSVGGGEKADDGADGEDPTHINAPGTGQPDQLPQPGPMPRPVEDFADYDESIDLTSECSSNLFLRTGAAQFADYLHEQGIVAFTYDKCQTGFHPRGLALDIQLADSESMQGFADWLVANDSEMARRLGLVQIIWDHHMWRSYIGGNGKPQGEFGAYYGTNPHTDHVHVSFGEAGANAETSFFSDVIGNGATQNPSTSSFTQCGILHVDEAIGFDRSLLSCNGQYSLAQQTDGNLVLYRADGVALWSSSTNGRGGYVAVMQSDGNFVVYNANGGARWSSGTDGNDGAELALTDDGDIVITQNGWVLWASNTGGV
jgi:hypothetical protein